MTILNQISEAVQAGKKNDVAILVQQAIDEGMPVQQVLDEGLIAGMGIIGEKFSRNEIFVPEMLIAARAMTAGTTLLRPLLIEEGIPAKGKAIISTVKGDVHDIGKNLVRMMLEGKGIEVVDLGVDIEPDVIVDHIKGDEALQLVCLSSLLTTSMTVLEETVRRIDEAGLHDRVKILIGGAPVTQAFADKIGADAYAPDAATGAEKAVDLLAG
ncbi:MAG: corrinoid protein [Coriobacteriia bacterium]|nr:corrinoid protein [Coriobacteriia bacterium]